jgi:homoserine O-acetyltransferase
MTTYRTTEEFGQRFSSGDEVRNYLESRGSDFLKKMSPERYLCLSESIDLHRVDPEKITIPVTLIAFRQDQLVPVEDVRALKAQLPEVAAYHEHDSLYGHDAFLKEVTLMSEALTQALT